MKKEDIKISIIVPVYNCDKYLKRCIESVIAQTYSNWELILVDDGSTDRSPLICDEYAGGKIRVVHKKNEGVSKARNAGLAYVEGDYVTFADSDDFLDLDTFQVYANEIFENDVDIIKVGYFREQQDGLSELVSADKNYRFNNTWDFHRILEHIKYYGFLWNMCIRRECVANIQFDERINWCEDHIFSYQCYFNCKTMSILKRACYHYQVHESGSLSDVRNPYIVKMASEQEMHLKMLLNAGVHKDIEEETENEYRYRLHTIVHLLYLYKSTYGERYKFSKECHPLKNMIYKEERIFFMKELPFCFRDKLLWMYYALKRMKRYWRLN